MASTITAASPDQQADGIGRAMRAVNRTLRSKSDVATLLVRLAGIERLCATVGHREVESWLKVFASEIQNVCRESDVAEHISDGKFAVILTGLSDRGHITLASNKIQRIARTVGRQCGFSAQMNVIVGVAFGPSQSSAPQELFRMAEIACLEAERKGDSVCFYEPESAGALVREWGLEKRLAAALGSGDLELYLQPKICTQTDRIVGAEALARWNDSDLGFVPPDVFIELAESTGQIFELTQFVVQSACRILSEWTGKASDLQLAVNISPLLIKNRDIVELVINATSIWGIDPTRLTLEITETALMDNRNASHDILSALRDLGCSVSIDDFGTGYSSLAYLKQIPANELKIDRTFVMGMLQDPGDYKIVEHSINIARSFSMSVVAEGVETAAVLEVLRQLGCENAQGYFISRPMPADEFPAFLESGDR